MKKNVPGTHTGDTLVAERARLGLSQQEMADALGVSADRYRHWEYNGTPEQFAPVVVLHELLAGRMTLDPSNPRQLVSSPLSAAQQALAWRTYAMELRERLGKLVEDMDAAHAARLHAEVTGEAPLVSDSVHAAIAAESSRSALDTGTGAGDRQSMSNSPATAEKYQGEAAIPSKVWLYPSQKDALRRLAEQTGKSIGDLVREGVELRLVQPGD